MVAGPSADLPDFGYGSARAEQHLAERRDWVEQPVVRPGQDRAWVREQELERHIVVAACFAAEDNLELDPLRAQGGVAAPFAQTQNHSALPCRRG